MNVAGEGRAGHPRLAGNRHRRGLIAACPLDSEPSGGLLEKGYGHKDFGVFAEVISGGPVAPGDKLEIAA